MRDMRFAAVVVFSVLLASSATFGADVPSAFNGKDLKGWKVPKDNIWWTARDGVLKVKSGPKKKGSTLWTDKEYTDFVIECEFKFGKGTVDSGFFMRNNHDQIQIGISGSLKRDMTGSPYIPGKGYPVEAKGVAKILRKDDWNAMKIEAKGNVYTVWLNGKRVMSYKSDSAIEKGPIGIQLHGNREMAIDYRKINILEIKK
ncbi:DUF1080 domain-containing protein [Planctomycetota bacterium]